MFSRVVHNIFTTATTSHDYLRLGHLCGNPCSIDIDIRDHTFSTHRRGTQHDFAQKGHQRIHALQLVDTTVCASITRRTKSNSVTFRRISLQSGPLRLGCWKNGKAQVQKNNNATHHVKPGTATSGFGCVGQSCNRRHTPPETN